MPHCSAFLLVVLVGTAVLGSSDVLGSSLGDEAGSGIIDSRQVAREYARYEDALFTCRNGVQIGFANAAWPSGELTYDER